MTFTYLFSVRVKPIQKFIIKNEKNVARNIVASKKYCFLIFVRLDWVVLENSLECKILISNLGESVIVMDRLNLV